MGGIVSVEFRAFSARAKAMPASIFISYSRKNSPFVAKIGASLEAAGYSVWIDRKDIHPTADWLETLLRGIADSDYFAAVLSPDLLGSDVCKVELNQAAALRKTLVPILLQDVAALPQEMARVQWVDFRDPLRFQASFEELAAALNRDPEWRAMHTRLLTAALDWERHGRPWSRLLHGAEIEDAEKWLAGADAKTRIPAPQHQTYIPASRRFARRWKLGLTAALVPLLLGVGLGFYISGHRGRETRARELAARAAQVAIDPQRLEESAIMAIEASDRLRDLRVSSTDAETVLRGSLKQLLRPISVGLHPGGIGGMAIDPARGVVATFAGSIDANVSPVDSGLTDKTVRIWRTQGGPVISVLRHESMVFAAVFSTNGWLVTGDIEGRVSVWDLSWPTSPTFVFEQKSPIVSLAGSEASSLLAAASSDGNVTVWDLRTRRNRYAYNDGQGEGVKLVTISPDSKYLASGGQRGIVQVRTLAGFRIVKTLKHRNGRAIKAMAFSPASDQLATGGEAGEFHLWSIPAGEDQFPLAHRDTVQDIRYAGGHAPYISTASRDGSLRTIEYSSNRGGATREFPAGYALWALANDPEGRYIAAARGDGLVDFWLRSQGAVVGRLAIPTHDVATAIAFPDARTAIVSDGGGKIHFSRMTAGYEAWETGSATDINAVAFSPGGEWMAGADFFGHAWIWRMDGGDPVKWKIALPPANPFSFSADGGRLAAAGDGTVTIMRMDSGAVETSFAIESNIGDVKWHPSRPFLAVARRDAGVKIYGLNGRMMHSLVEGAVELSFAPGGQALACVTLDHGLRFWLWESADGADALPVMKDVRHAVFAVDKPILATLHRDGRLRTWTFSSNLSVAERWSTYVCPDPSALAIGGQGGRVAVGCKDGRVEVYEGNAGAEIARAEYPGAVESVGFSGNLRLFAAAGRDGLKGYYVDRADLIREACARVSANLSLDQWIKDVGDDQCRTVCPNAPPGCGK